MSSLTDKLISPLAWALAGEPESWAYFSSRSLLSYWTVTTAFSPSQACVSDSVTRARLQENTYWRIIGITWWPLKVRHAAPRLMDSLNDKDRSLSWQWQRADLKASPSKAWSPSKCWAQGFIQTKGSPPPQMFQLLYAWTARQCRYQGASPYRKLLIIIFIKLLFDIVFPYLQIFYQTHFKIKTLSERLLWDSILIFSLPLFFIRNAAENQDTRLKTCKLLLKFKAVCFWACISLLYYLFRGIETSVLKLKNVIYKFIFLCLFSMFYCTPTVLRQSLH